MDSKIKILISILITLLIFSVVNLFGSSKNIEGLKTFEIFKNLTNASSDEYYIRDKNILGLNDKKVGEYRCNSKNCKYFNIINNYVMIYDTKYFIYDYIKKTSTDINLGKKIYSNIQIVEFDETIIGLIVKNDNNKMAYYSLKDNKYNIDFNYNSISFTKEMYEKGYTITNTYDINKQNYNYFIVNINSGEELLTSELKIDSISNNGFLYFLQNIDNTNSKIYNSNLQLLFNGNTFNQHVISNDGNIMVANIKGNIFSKYNSEGKLIRNSRRYKSIEQIMEDYVIVIDNNYFKIVDYNGKVISNILKYNDNTQYDNIKSYKNENIIVLYFSRNENNSKICEKYNYNIITNEIITETDMCK